MGTDPATILHSEGNKYVSSPVASRHRVERVSIRLELLVLNLFGRIARYRSDFAEDGVAVDGSDRPVNDKMAAPLCKV